MHINSLINIGIGGCLTGMGASVLGVNPLSLQFIALIFTGQGLAWMPDLAKKMRTTLTNRVSATTFHTSSKLTPHDNPVELEEKEHSYEDSISDDNPLIQRIQCVERQILEGIKILNIDKPFSVICDMNAKALSPSVKKKGGGFEIKIPLLFLLKPEDLDPSSSCHYLVKNLNSESAQYLKLFKIFWQNTKLANQAKRFVLFHELAHVACGHIQTPPHNMRESRRREKEADLVAAAASGAADGGAYLFDLTALYAPTNLQTHPPDRERANYLKEISIGYYPYTMS